MTASVSNPFSRLFCWGTLPAQMWHIVWSLIIDELCQHLLLLLLYFWENLQKLDTANEMTFVMSSTETEKLFLWFLYSINNTLKKNVEENILKVSYQYTDSMSESLITMWYWFQYYLPLSGKVMVNFEWTKSYTFIQDKSPQIWNNFGCDTFEKVEAAVSVWFCLLMQP